MQAAAAIGCPPEEREALRRLRREVKPLKLERESLAYSPKFRRILQAARRQLRKTGGIGHEEFWEAVEAETP